MQAAFHNGYYGPGSVVGVERDLFGEHVVLKGRVLDTARGRPWNGPRLIVDVGQNVEGRSVMVTTGDAWRLIPDLAVRQTSDDPCLILRQDLGVLYVEAWRGWPLAFEELIKKECTTGLGGILSDVATWWRDSLAKYKDVLERPERHAPPFAAVWSELLAYMGGMEKLAEFGRRQQKGY